MASRSPASRIPPRRAPWPTGRGSSLAEQALRIAVERERPRRRAGGGRPRRRSRRSRMEKDEEMPGRSCRSSTVRMPRLSSMSQRRSSGCRRRPAGTRGRSRGSRGTSRTATGRRRLQPLLPQRRPFTRPPSRMSSARCGSRKRAPKSAVQPIFATTSSSSPWPGRGRVLVGAGVSAPAGADPIVDQTAAFEAEHRAAPGDGQPRRWIHAAERARRRAASRRSRRTARSPPACSDRPWWRMLSCCLGAGEQMPWAQVEGLSCRLPRMCLGRPDMMTLQRALADCSRPATADRRPSF